MTARLRVHTYSMSVDGFAAGPDQSVDDPLGVRGEELHEWAFATRTFQGVHGEDPAGSTGIDDDMAARGEVGIGATIMGRNMFGPIRGDWPDDTWTGWWGPNPPFHHPVFVLTHHARPTVEVEGGTTFHFVTDGIESAREQALDAAGGLDVRIGGGADTIRQYLRAGLVDHVHLALVPILLGSGERLFDDLDGISDAFDVRFTPSDAVVHVEMTRR
jgi:dihydrofolate reductase